MTHVSWYIPLTIHNSQSTIHNLRSAIHDPQSTIPNHRFTIYDPQSMIHDPQSEIHDLQSTIHNQPANDRAPGFNSLICIDEILMWWRGGEWSSASPSTISAYSSNTKSWTEAELSSMSCVACSASWGLWLLGATWAVARWCCWSPEELRKRMMMRMMMLVVVMVMMCDSRLRGGT